MTPRRSPTPADQRTNRAVALLIVAMIVSAGAANVWTTLVRATVPLELDATVERTYTRNRGSDGTEVSLLELDDGRTLRVDKAVKASLAPGDHLTKAAWDWELRIETSRGTSTLALTGARELPRTVVLMTVVGGVGAMVVAFPAWVDDRCRRAVARLRRLVR